MGLRLMPVTAESIIDHLREDSGVETADLTPETLLFSTGLVDSFAMVDLVGFIETRCGAKMKPSDVNLDNLDSIGRILNYVQSNFADSA